MILKELGKMSPYVRNKEALLTPMGWREHKIGKTNYLLKIQVLANT